MFGRRRRTPLLGAALIAGTATVAARHGAKSQSRAEAQRQFEMEQEMEFRRIAKEREELQNQRNIDKAVNEAMAKQQASQPQSMSPTPAGNAPAITQSAAPGPPPMYAGPDAYASPPGLSPYLHPAMAAGAVPARPRSASAADTGVCFCSGCGSQCLLGDNFCSGCGRSLGAPPGGGLEKTAQGM